MKWKIVVSVIVISLICFTASFLIPEEEELPTAPVISTYEMDDYEMTSVLQGDVVKSATVTFAYSATNIIDLYFSVDGYEIENIYVSNGDTVQVGDVLAELNMEDLTDQLYTYNIALGKLELQLEQLEEKYESEYNNQIEYLATLTEEELSDAQTAEEKVSGYAEQIDELEDDIWIQNLKIAEVEEKISDRQIVATIDGTITYVKSVSEGETSSESSKMFRIIDTESMVFSTSTKYEDMLEIGQTVEVEIDDEMYTANVISWGDESEESTSSKFTYYLQLETLQIDLEDGDSVEYTYIMGTSEDVLYLPSDALYQSNGKDIVYYINEDGIRDAKFVELGLVGNGYVEVISGVEFGEQVIIGAD